MERISGYQIFVLTLMFQIGSTVIFGFASQAGRDAWIAAFVANMLGCLLILLYGCLFRLQPGLTLVQWFPEQFGKWIGVPIAWLYPLTFIYAAGRVLRDFGDFVTTFVLPNTPQWVILFVFIAVISYGVACGPETIARVCEFTFPFVFLLSVMEIFFLTMSSAFNIRHLLPVLEHGWGQIWKTVWPLNVTVPYGECIVFAMTWKMLTVPKSVFKYTLSATILYGGLMMFGDLLAIITLGESTFERSIYPLHFLLRQLSIGNFIQNLDAILVLQGIIVGYFKISLYFFGAVRGIQELTGIRNRLFLILPLSMVIPVEAMFMASNVVEHMDIGLRIIPRLLLVPLFLVLPVALLAVIWGRKIWANKKGNQSP